VDVRVRSLFTDLLSAAHSEESDLIFSDRSIKDALASGSIVIDPYEPSYVQPSSVDLRVANGFRVFVNHKYSEIDPRAPQQDLTSRPQTVSSM
jgi:deoxycytidine triphosphate deaminase